MTRIIFLEDFDYKPLPQQTFSYKEGDIAVVKQEIADIAIAEGKAKLTETPAPSSGIKDTIKKFPKQRRTKKVVEPDAFLEEPSATVN